jgi:pimeloyl-ACP methyl ester carboxylesterase
MARSLRIEPDRIAELAALMSERDIPGLVVAGAHDDAWSVPAQRDMATRLGVAFELIEGAAHSPNTENPAGLLRALLPAWRAWLGPASPRRP